MRLTVVTPTLNAAAYIEECLSSVERQNEEDVEHLVVDGGSTDSTEAIVRGHSAATWISRPGWRQTRAINEGFRRASGEIVAWLNADDMYLDGSFHLILGRFAANSRLDLAYGDCEVIGPHGEKLWWERPGPYNFRRLLRRGNYIPQPAAFIRRRVLDELGFLDESFEFGMDYDLWLRLRGRTVEYIPQALARFRWHPSSKSARGQMQSWNEFLRIVRRHGGGWTPEIGWAYARCLITIARTRAMAPFGGGGTLRPLTRGHNLLESRQVTRRHIAR